MADSAAKESDLEEMVRHLQSLRRGKWIILSSGVAGLLLGIFVSLLATPQYIYSVPYSINFFPHDISENCNDSIACRDETIAAMLRSKEKDGWTINSKSQILVKSSKESIAPNVYYEELELKKRRFNEMILSNALSEIKFLSQDLPGQLESTETFAENLLSALRIQNKLKSEGLSAINYSTPTVRKSLPSYWIIVGVFGLFGLAVGVTVVFAREFMKGIFSA